MHASTEIKVADANHLSHYELKTPLNKIDFGDESSQIIFHDFIRHDVVGWKIDENSSLAMLIGFQQGCFQARCFEIADHLISGYSGATWKISKNGIYCIDSKSTDRFIVKSPNYMTAECNPLEAGLIVTFMALDYLMVHKNETFVKAMYFYHHYLKTFIKEQALVENPIIDSNKLSLLLD